MQKPEAFLAKSRHLIKLFQQLKHKSELARFGPEADYVHGLILDKEYLKYRLKVREQGYVPSYNAHNGKIMTREPLYNGPSVSKQSAKTRHRYLQMREELYRGACLGDDVRYTTLRTRGKERRSAECLSSITSRTLATLRSSAKSTPRIRARPVQYAYAVPLTRTTS
jgi:hypothetical protein